MALSGGNTSLHLLTYPITGSLKFSASPHVRQPCLRVSIIFLTSSSEIPGKPDVRWEGEGVVSREGGREEGKDCIARGRRRKEGGLGVVRVKEVDKTIRVGVSMPPSPP